MRVLLAAALLLIAGCASAASGSGPAGAHLSTAVRSLHEGQVVDGVPCLTEDLPVHHIHVHLQILLDGAPVAVPAGIGVGRPWGVVEGFIATGSCFAWLHTHDTTGVVHIVTPEEASFTLGQLFEVWGQPLGPDSALSFRGALAVLVDGRQVPGDPRAVRLANLDNIVLELGRPPSSPPPATYDFAAMSR